MSDIFYVVTGDGPDATAVVFNRTDKDADNEAAANDFLTERKNVAPWFQHRVMSESEFAAFSEPTNEPGDNADATD
jgi:hypothetical protein